ncbi:hypothetical protein EYF80_000162 [Liparis tanakae]|uniref:Uncharacterized protein n=1 Tax=Liparis tanakae TaxID=230148 RepID=A0A4Z2JGX8_9TELE|nr:hypothetical protein EYF80_000162 [Liparis tanakae]
MVPGLVGDGVEDLVDLGVEIWLLETPFTPNEQEEKKGDEVKPLLTGRLAAILMTSLRVYSLLTAPESNLMASVMSVSTCPKECAVFLLSSMRTALRGLTPLRMTVTSLGLMKSLVSCCSSLFSRTREERERDVPVLEPTDQLGLTFLA